MKSAAWDMAGEDREGTWRVDEVPWSMFYEDNFALHGAYWHNQFGHRMSHGCINIPPLAARDLFQWIDPGLPEGWNNVSSMYPDHFGTLVVVR
jgi:lipoprotein-anchoring transpeptidase ErfK/SrfK